MCESPYFHCFYISHLPPSSRLPMCVKKIMARTNRENGRLAAAYLEFESRKKDVDATPTAMMEIHCDHLKQVQAQRYASTRSHMLAPIALRLAAYTDPSTVPSLKTIKENMGEAAFNRLCADDHDFLLQETRRIHALRPSDSLPDEDIDLMELRNFSASLLPASDAGDLIKSEFETYCSEVTENLEELRDAKDNLAEDIDELKDSLNDAEKDNVLITNIDEQMDDYDAAIAATRPQPAYRFTVDASSGDESIAPIRPRSHPKWNSISDAALYQEGACELSLAAAQSKHITTEVDKSTNLTSYRIVASDKRHYHPKTDLHGQLSRKLHDTSPALMQAKRFDRANANLHSAEAKLAKALKEAEAANPSRHRRDGADDTLNDAVKDELKSAIQAYKKAKLIQQSAAQRLIDEACLHDAESMNILGNHLRNSADSDEITALLRSMEAEQQQAFVDAMHSHEHLQRRMLTNPDNWREGKGLGGALWKASSKFISFLHGKPVGYYDTRRDGLNDRQRQAAFEEYIKKPAEGSDNPAHRHFKELLDAGLTIKPDTSGTKGSFKFSYDPKQLKRLQSRYQEWRTARLARHKTEQTRYRQAELAKTGKCPAEVKLTETELEEAYHTETGRRAPPSEARADCIVKWHTEKFGDYCVKNANKFKTTAKDEASIKARRDLPRATPPKSRSGVDVGMSAGEEKPARRLGTPV